MKQTKRLIAAAALAALALAWLAPSAASAADIVRIGPSYTVGPLKLDAGSASNINMVISCPGAANVAFQFSWGLSNTITTAASNLTALVQTSVDGVNWTWQTVSGSTGGANPLDGFPGAPGGPVTFSATVAGGTNHVAITNMALGGIPYIRLKWLTNGATTYMNYTNVYVKAWVK